MCSVSILPVMTWRITPQVLHTNFKAANGSVQTVSCARRWVSSPQQWGFSCTSNFFPCTLLLSGLLSICRLTFVRTYIHTPLNREVPKSTCGMYICIRSKYTVYIYIYPSPHLCLLSLYLQLVVFWQLKVCEPAYGQRYLLFKHLIICC